MRIATPISTCSVMAERSDQVGNMLAISTPRFIGPGCMTKRVGPGQRQPAFESRP
jgi:hypothetical protein